MEGKSDSIKKFRSKPFEYKPVDFSRIASVELISRDHREYREFISSVSDKPGEERKRILESNRIFRIKYQDGKIGFKVPDLIITQEDIYCIIEIYSWRESKEKEQQPRDYGKLFKLATGETPGLVLIFQDWESEIIDGVHYSYNLVVIKSLNEIGEAFQLEEILGGIYDTKTVRERKNRVYFA